jgi:hypothetical protein
MLRTRSAIASTAKQTPSDGLSGNTLDSTSQLKNARTMTQWVRTVFGARPAVSMLRNTVLTSF